MSGGADNLPVRSITEFKVRFGIADRAFVRLCASGAAIADPRFPKMRIKKAGGSFGIDPKVARAAVVECDARLCPFIVARESLCG